MKKTFLVFEPLLLLKADFAQLNILVRIEHLKLVYFDLAVQEMQKKGLQRLSFFGWFVKQSKENEQKSLNFDDLQNRNLEDNLFSSSFFLL